MPQSKVIKYELEDVVMDARRGGRSNAQMATACNDNLAGRGIEDTLTSKAVERYLATLDRATVPAAHQPQAAQANAMLAVDVAARINLLDERVKGWLDEVENAVTQMRGVLWDPYLQAPAHPKAAQESAALLAESLSDVMEYLPDAVTRELRSWVSPVPVFVPDWHARTAVARELRETAKTVVDLMERIHNAEQIAAFQEEVVIAIRAADEPTAKRVIDALRGRQTIRRAALLGAA